MSKKNLPSLPSQTTATAEILDFLFQSQEVGDYGKLCQHYYILGVDKLREKIMDYVRLENIKNGRPEDCLEDNIFAEQYKDYINYHNKNLVLRCNSDNFVNDIRHLYIADGYDIFITKNPLKTKVLSKREYAAQKEKGTLNENYSNDGKSFVSCEEFGVSRCDSNVIALTNIVLDIDCHEDLAPDEFIKIKDDFTEYMDEMFEDLPTPTLIDFTGRGFHVWYSIKSAAKSMDWLYRKIAQALNDKLEVVLQDYKICFPELSVDKSVATSVSGLIRVPGTKNTLSNADPEILKFTPVKYSLDELKDVLGIVIVKKSAKSKTNGKKPAYETKKNKKNLQKRRKQAIEEYAESKLEDGKINSFRHNILMLYYNVLVQLMDIDKAKSMCEKFNAKYFAIPLDKNDLYFMYATFKKVGYYKYTTNAFNDKFGCIIEKKSVDTSSLRKKEKRAKAKEARNFKIITTFVECDNVTKTARITGHAYNTVKKVIEAKYEKIEQLKKKLKNARDRRICASFRLSRSLKKAAKAGKCCIQTVKKVVERYRELYYFLMEDMQESLPDIYNAIQHWKTQHHFVLYKNEFLAIVDRTSEYYGLSKAEVNIAVAPYINPYYSA